ncbi:hypothetical protein Tco_1257899 [Tanacetum coccineum]
MAKDEENDQWCNLKESEEKTTAMYITVLSQSIQDELKLLPIWTIDQSHNLAMKVEMSMSKQALNFEETLEGKLNSIDVNQFNQTQLTIKTNISLSLTTLVLASKSGVKKQVITKKMDSNPYSKIVHPKCFKYSLPCHRSNECPNRKMNAYVGENHEGDTEIDFGDDLEHISEFAQDEGEVVNLMVQRRPKIFPEKQDF